MKVEKVPKCVASCAYPVMPNMHCATSAATKALFRAKWVAFCLSGPECITNYELSHARSVEAKLAAADVRRAAAEKKRAAKPEEFPVELQGDDYVIAKARRAGAGNPQKKKHEEHVKGAARARPCSC